MASRYFGCIPYIKSNLNKNPAFITNDFIDFIPLQRKKGEFIRFLIKPIINNILVVLKIYINV